MHKFVIKKITEIEQLTSYLEVNQSSKTKLPQDFFRKFEVKTTDQLKKILPLLLQQEKSFKILLDKIQIPKEVVNELIEKSISE